MTENKEILMYIGGKPKKKTEKKPEKDSRDDFDKKWDKITSGKATIEEIGTKFTNGSKNSLKKNKLGKIVGFSKKINRMRILTLHVGYSKEEMESKAFQDYMKRTKAEAENLFGKKNIELGFYIPAEGSLNISSYGMRHYVTIDDEQCAVLKRRLQKDKGETIDIVDVRINPKAVGRDYFGSGGYNLVSSGPVENESGTYNLPFKYLFEHELIHSISFNARKHNPAYFGDGYYRSINLHEARCIYNGYHSEFILADKNNKPIKPQSKTMEKVLKVAKPEDKNVFMVDKDGVKHKVLVVNPDDNIMNGSFDISGKREKAIKEGTYITKAQRIAIDDVIKDYLIGEKRLVADKEVQKPKLVTKNNSDKNKIDIVKKAKEGQRA